MILSSIYLIYFSTYLVMTFIGMIPTPPMSGARGAGCICREPACLVGRAGAGDRELACPVWGTSVAVRWIREFACFKGGCRTDNITTHVV